MNYFKKCVARLLISAVIICFGAPAVTVNAAEVSYTAQLDKTTLNVSFSEQKVVMTVSASDAILVDGIEMTVIIPEGWSIASIENEELGFAPKNVNLAEGRVVYAAPDGQNHAVRLLAKVTYNVPAGADAGDYLLGVRDLTLSKDGGSVWKENGSANATVTLQGNPYIAGLDTSSLRARPVQQSVVMTVKTAVPVQASGFAMDMVIPEGWSIASVENDEPDFTDGNFFEETGKVVYVTSDARNTEVQMLVKVTYRVPANVVPGTYQLGIRNLELVADAGDVTLEKNGDASVSLVIEKPVLEVVDNGAGEFTLLLPEVMEDTVILIAGYDSGRMTSCMYLGGKSVSIAQVTPFEMTGKELKVFVLDANTHAPKMGNLTKTITK